MDMRGMNKAEVAETKRALMERINAKVTSYDGRTLRPETLNSLGAICTKELAAMADEGYHPILRELKVVCECRFEKVRVWFSPRTEMAGKFVSGEGFDGAQKSQMDFVD